MSWMPRAVSWSDVALAAGLTVATVGELFSSYAFEGTPVQGPSAFHIGVAVVAGMGLAWRRAHPLLVTPAVLAVLAVQPFVVTAPNSYGESIITIVAIYSAAAWAPSLRSAAAIGGVCVLLGGMRGLWDRQDPLGAVLSNVIFGAMVLLTGIVVRRHRERAEEMRQQRDRADARTREIAVAERARIARELHDVVAHGMSVVVLQARGGRRTLDRDQAMARRALEDIERVASGCLDEMRRLLELLRGSETEAVPLAPQPTLAELPQLVDRARSSGASVDLVVDGQRRELAPAVELSAFRIAQEALTNTLKHAPGSRVRVRVSYDVDAVAIDVTDDGPGVTASAGGHGLVGMRERAELFGGTFAAGPEPGGGFGVRVRIPVAVAAP